MSAGDLVPDTTGNAHPVQTRNRLHVFRYHQKRFSCRFRKNNVARLDSLKPGKESRLDCSFGTEHVSVLENKIVVAKRDSDHACSSCRDPAPGSTRLIKLPERTFPV